MLVILVVSIGRLNSHILFTFGTALTNFFIWTFASTALFGLCCASYYSMCNYIFQQLNGIYCFFVVTVITAAILTPEQYRTGMSNLFTFKCIFCVGYCACWCDWSQCGIYKALFLLQDIYGYCLFCGWFDSGVPKVLYQSTFATFRDILYLLSRSCNILGLLH